MGVGLLKANNICAAAQTGAEMRRMENPGGIVSRIHSSNEDPASSTVIVGIAPPSLEDVISGASCEQPFDLKSFTVFAKRNLFVETLLFLAEVDKLRQEQHADCYASDLRHILDEYVVDGAPSQVNLSEKARTETEAGVSAVLDALASQGSSKEPDRSLFDTAYHEILSLLKNDQYSRYVDYVVVQRQLKISRLEALWWRQESLTLTRFFTFPSPVDSVESRLHACVAIFLLPAAYFLTLFAGFSWLWVYVTYGYLARWLCGPRLDPQAFFVLFLLRPIVTERVGLLVFTRIAKRFAQFCGLMLSSVCVVAAFLEKYWLMTVIASCLFVSTFLWGCCDICLACHIYLWAADARLLPQFACEDCRVRYIKGKGDPVPEKYVSQKKTAQRSRVSQITRYVSRAVSVDLTFCRRISDKQPSSRKVSPGRLTAGGSKVANPNATGSLSSPLEDLPLDDNKNGAVVPVSRTAEDSESPSENWTTLAGSTMSDDVDTGALQNSLGVATLDEQEPRVYLRPRSFGVVVDTTYATSSGQSPV